MKRRETLVLSCCALLMAAALPAQDYEGRLANMTEWTIDAATFSEFEAGLKLHNEFHAENHDPTALLTWEVITGEDAGKYWRGSLGHSWADFDEDALEGDAEDSATHLNPHITAAVPRIWGLDLGASNLPDGLGTPAAFAQVSEFRLAVGGGRNFHKMISKVAAAAKEAEWQHPHLWYWLVSGGAPTAVLVVPHDTWADFKEPTPSFGEMLVAALGEEGMEELMGSFVKSVKSERTYVLAFRADLSYIPASDGD